MPYLTMLDDALAKVRADRRGAGDDHDGAKTGDVGRALRPVTANNCARGKCTLLHLPLLSRRESKNQ